MFMLHIVVMVLQMHTYLQTHQVIYTECEQLLYINQTSIMWFKQIQGSVSKNNLHKPQRMICTYTDSFSANQIVSSSL